MITFWGQVALATLAVYALACWLITKIPNPKRSNKAEKAEHGLEGGNRERSQSKFYGWY